MYNTSNIHKGHNYCGHFTVFENHEIISVLTLFDKGSYRNYVDATFLHQEYDIAS